MKNSRMIPIVLTFAFPVRLRSSGNSNVEGEKPGWRKRSVRVEISPAEAELPWIPTNCRISAILMSKTGRPQSPLEIRGFLFVLNKFMNEGDENN